MSSMSCLPALGTHSQQLWLVSANTLPDGTQRSKHAALWHFFHPTPLPAAASVPARSQSIAVGTDDLVDPSGAGEAYYYDPDEEVEPEPKALRWARENPWCAGS